MNDPSTLPTLVLSLRGSEPLMKLVRSIFEESRGTEGSGANPRGVSASPLVDLAFADNTSYAATTIDTYVWYA